MSFLITFALAVGSVGLWTLRVALTARDSRVIGSAVAAVEAVVFVVAFSHVTGSLNAPLQIAIYGAGVGSGTFLGLTVDRTIRRSGARRDQDAARTRLSPGAKSSSPAGVSNAQATSPGEP
jgi:uncharacterized protein YebE (UPF0316 family)